MRVCFSGLLTKQLVLAISPIKGGTGAEPQRAVAPRKGSTRQLYSKIIHPEFLCFWSGAGSPNGRLPDSRGEYAQRRTVAPGTRIFRGAHLARGRPRPPSLPIRRPILTKGPPGRPFVESATVWAQMRIVEQDRRRWHRPHELVGTDTLRRPFIPFDTGPCKWTR